MHLGFDRMENNKKKLFFEHFKTILKKLLIDDYLRKYLRPQNFHCNVEMQLFTHARLT